MRTIAHYTILAVVMLLLFASNIIFGAIDIPLSDIISIVCGGEAEKASWKFIILESRTPQALTALLSGAALATS
ncbi:MAG: iron chelate uptake ABC transporter family permease subunit, partial [Prevotella sp.]|nr:iron chelate uptake ABC transporter family permease subunit [Prevotella sp.]